MQTLSQQRVKVDRLALIAALESQLGKGDKDYQRQLREHERTLARARAELQKTVERLARAGLNGEVEDQSYATLNYRNNARATVSLSSKTKVAAKPVDRQCELRRTIDVLRLSNEETVAISGQQYAVYFPCNLDGSDD
jgi:hypothetical protein